MVLLCDNDIVLKLAAFGLLDATIEALAGEEIFVLDTARHRLRKPGRCTREKFTPEVINAALEWTEAATPLNDPIDSDIADAFVSAEYEDEEGAICRIDAGELILFANAKAYPHAQLLTGDKKALYALGRHRENDSHAKAIHAALRQRVVCTEAAICLNIANLGFKQARTCIAPARHCDNSTRVAFGAGLHTEESNAMEMLNEYLSHCEKTLGENWLWRP